MRQDCHLGLSDGPNARLFPRKGKTAQPVHLIRLNHQNAEGIMGMQTAELPVPVTSKPLLKVIRTDGPPTIRRLGFVAALDMLGQSVGVYSLTGTLLHRTAAFRAALDHGEIASLVRTAVSTIAKHAELSRRRDIVPSPVSLADKDRVVRASLYQPSDEAMVLVCIEAGVTPHTPLTDEQIAARFGLTPAELRVAQRLAAGEPNKVIAGALGVSEHTTRHHTEHVLRKLGVNSRAAVANRLIPTRAILR